MRVLIANQQGQVTQDLTPDRVLQLTALDEINGEHSLTIQTLDFIEKQSRVLVKDPNTGNVREYVVLGVDESHEDVGLFINTYYCVESWQYELAGTVLKSQPGKNNPVTATAALTAALAGSRWSVGTVEPTTRTGASFYYLSGYEALSLVVKNWGGEVSARVVIAPNNEVAERYIDLVNKLGSTELVDVFEYARNVAGITKTEADAPYPCRIVPRGSAIESDNGGYGRKIGIASVNPTGKEYLENSETAELVKLPYNGGYIYPTQVVEYDGIEDPQLLYDTALADLPKYTTQQVEYKVEVLNIAGWRLAASHTKALNLGDAVGIIDREYPGELRLTGRVVKLEANYLDTRYNVATIGFNDRGLAGTFEAINSKIGSLGNWRDLLQGALAASETGKLTTTSDLTVGGNLKLLDKKTASTSTDAITDNTAPSATESFLPFLVGDKNGFDFARYGGRAIPASQGALIQARRTVNGSVRAQDLFLGIDASGNSTVTIGGTGAEAAWRAALGMEMVATAPTINNGSNFTISGVTARKQWGMVQLLFNIVTANALTANTNYTVGTISTTAYRPAMEADLVPRAAGAAASTLYRGYIRTSGEIIIRPNQAVAAGATLYAWTIYIAANF